MLAGLGEKIVVPDVDCTTEEFHEILMQSFPKLRNGGGFELLRCASKYTRFRDFAISSVSLPTTFIQ